MKEFVGLHEQIFKIRQIRGIPNVSKLNTTCSERKLKLPPCVTDMFPAPSDKSASDNNSDATEQLGAPGNKDATQCSNLLSLSLCHFIKRCNCIKSLFIVALNLFNAVYFDRNSNLDCDRYFAQMDILYQ